MQIQGFYINLNVISGDYWTTDNCRFADAVLYQMSIGDTYLPDNGDMYITNCLFEGIFFRQQRAGVYYHSGGGMKMTNCKFNQWDIDINNRPIYAIYVEMDNPTSDILISNTSIENYDSSAIYIHQVGTTTFYNVLIDNVEIATSVAKSSPIKIIGGGSGDFGLVTLSNYTVNDYGTSSNANPWITVTNANYVTIGTGTVRYYAAASISGGTNRGTVFDPVIGYLGLNKSPGSTLDLQNYLGTQPTIINVNNNQANQYSGSTLFNNSSKYISQRYLWFHV